MLGLKEFVRRKEVLRLYRDMFRVIHSIDDPFYRDWLRDSARLEFRNNSGETDESEIKVMISRGKQQLAETKSMISQATRGV